MSNHESWPRTTAADWRAQVEKELAGKSFDKVLVDDLGEGLKVAPLYTEVPAALPQREVRSSPFRICIRSDKKTIASDIAGGAESLWLGLDDVASVTADHIAKTHFVFDTKPERQLNVLDGLDVGLSFVLNFDPLGRFAKKQSSAKDLADELKFLPALARTIHGKFPHGIASMVSTIPVHEAGADAADEIAHALSSGAVMLEALLDDGSSADGAAGQIALQVALGRDTFVELCKVRALRVCWRKLLAACGAKNESQTWVHCVCSSRTLTLRDPWVNMLRVTTQMFAGILGGADLVTPNAFDRAFGEESALGRRVANNTGLVLREESYLGKVLDPAGGSYYFETLTDSLAREAWRRFQKIQKEGGVVSAIESGRLAAQLEKSWSDRLAQIARRKIAILGVSEFANLDEKLPHSIPNSKLSTAHREAETFEALRVRAEQLKSPPEAILVTLGALAETRPRVGFSAGFLAAGGIGSRETSSAEKASIACICGTDERYASEAAACARALKSAGCQRVLVAGRPGALEKDLRAAGVDGFIFVGCDVVATLTDLLNDLEGAS